MNYVKDTEKKKFLGDQYDSLKDKVDWNYYGFKKGLKESRNKKDISIKS